MTKLLYGETSTLTSMDAKNISESLDKLVVKMKRNGQMDFSHAISRIFLAKAYEDTLDTTKATCKEIELYVNRKKKTGLNGDYVMAEDIEDILHTLLMAIEDLATDRKDELMSQMSWIECAEYADMWGPGSGDEWTRLGDQSETD